MYSVAPTDVSSLPLRDPKPLWIFAFFKLSIHRRKKCTFLPMCPSCDCRRGVWEGWMARGALCSRPLRVWEWGRLINQLWSRGFRNLGPGPPNHLIHWPLYRHAANKEEERCTATTREEKNRNITEAEFMNVQFRWGFVSRVDCEYQGRELS